MRVKCVLGVVMREVGRGLAAPQRQKMCRVLLQGETLRRDSAQAISLPMHLRVRCQYEGGRPTCRWYSLRAQQALLVARGLINTNSPSSSVALTDI